MQRTDYLSEETLYLMCGIAALIAKKRTFLSQGEKLNQMLDVMQHRGPDGRGVVQEPGIDMGMVRLAIVDIGGGEQPIWNEDHTVVLICNGEIYNADDLREELTAAGHRFSTGSDVEVILHVYEEEGSTCIARLEGIFALAIWDSQQKLFFAGRDRLGIKPLYYADLGTHWIFASEYPAISAVLEGEPTWDTDALHSYYALRYTTREHTLDSRIKRMLPAQSISVVAHGSLHKVQYWRPICLARTEHLKSEISPARQLQELIKQAVLRQDAREVKSAVLLSGGLDSSAILALRHQLNLASPETAITIAFEEPFSQTSQNEYSEMHHAKSVAKLFQAHHVVQVVSAEEALAAFPRIIACLGEPIADPTAIPLWFASKLAKEHDCKVVYSGEGVDELFGGYAVYQQPAWIHALQRIPKSGRQMLYSLLHERGLRGQGVLLRSLQEPSDWYQGVGGSFNYAERERMMGGQDQPMAKSSPLIQTWKTVREGAVGTLQQMLVFDLLTWLPDNTLAKSDRISMAHSVEFRVPYLDDAIVDFALSSPNSYKRRWGGKPIVRRALTGVVPRAIIQRRKVGFPVPVSAWLFGEWNAYARSVLLANDAVTRDWYRTLVPALFTASGSKQERAGRLLYSLLTLELFLKQQTMSHITGERGLREG